MCQTPEEVLLHRLQTEGEQVAQVMNSTVYTLQGARFITWTMGAGSCGVAKLPLDHGPDPGEAAVAFLRERRVRREECEACAQVAQDVARARELAGDWIAWGVADQVARFIRERLED